MRKIFYEKVGRKYVPVSEYDSDLLDALPKGSHLVMCYPGGKSTRYNIEPSLAPMIAASRIAEDAIVRAISDKSEIRRRNRAQTALTNEQHAAWENLVDKLGEDARMLEYASAHDCAMAGIKAMVEEAEKLMTVPAVKKAYEQFLFVCELTKDAQYEPNS